MTGEELTELDRYRDWDAAYVLGALGADDRRVYERHLTACPECSAAVAELAGLPGILGKLSPDDALSVVAAPEEHPLDAQLRDRVHTPGLVQQLAAAARRRRRRMRLAMVAAVVAVVVVVSIGGIAIGLGQSSPDQTVAMAPLHEKVITASLEIAKKGWGTSFAWSCTYHGADGYGVAQSYDLVVVTKTGHESTVATWTSAGPAAAGLTASTAIPTDNIRRVEIRLSGTKTPLLQTTL